MRSFLSSSARRFLLAALLGALGVLVSPAAPARAHATLVASDPPQGSVIGYSPVTVTLTFNEPVRVVAGKIQVLAPNGKRIDIEPPTVVDRTVTIPLRVPPRPLGTYLVSYRVISADSHPVSGTVTFSVGAPSSVPSATEGGVHPVVRVAVPAAKYLGYAGLALIVGPAMFLSALWPRRLSRTRAARVVRAGFALVALATVGSLWLQAPYVSGASPTDVTEDELREGVESPFGVVLIARLGLLLAAWILLRPIFRARGAYRISRRRGTLLVLVALAGAATWPLSGHAQASPMSALMIPADILHIGAMALWVGGLVTLALPLRPVHPRVFAHLLPAWSRWAALAVCWLVIAGVLMALVEVGPARALVETDYGRLVLAKVGILGVLLAAAAIARRAVLRRATATVRRVVRWELVGMAVVLAASAVVVHTTPGRVAVMEAQEVVQDSFAQTLHSPLYTLQFEIYPVQLGENNTVHAYAYTPDGRPLSVKEWWVTTLLPERDVEPTGVPLLGIEPHHAVGAVAFPIPGEWELRFTLLISEIDQATVSTRVRVS